MTALSLGQVSKLLGIRSNRIDHAISQGFVKEPLRVANRRVFQKHNIAELARYFHVELKTEQAVATEVVE
jgi:DNA-binding transcriptional MerR regulator